MEEKKEKEVEKTHNSTSKNSTSRDKKVSMEEAATLQEPINKPNKVKLEYPTKHLIGFEDLKAATALFGEEYTLIFKGLWYNLLSYPIKISKLNIGRLKPDGRISPLFVINSGRGKGELKRVQKGFIDYIEKGSLNAEEHEWTEPTSLHAEQLVGKTVYNKKEKEHKPNRGYLDAKFLIIDEAYNLLSSKELHYSEARKYIRTALDPYPHNEIVKRSVDVEKAQAINYKPTCPITLFIQPLRFENDILVLEGDIRRFLPVYVYMGDSDKVDALKRRVLDSSNDDMSLIDFGEKISGLEAFESFKMSSDTKVRFAELSILLVQRGTSYSPKIANFLEMIAFTIQNNLLKFAAVQAYQHGRSLIEVEDVDLAFIDLFELLEHCYQYVEYKIPGNLDYGDGWQGARLKDQEALKWLYEMGAISEDETTVSVKDYEDRLGQIFNVRERQAQKYKNKHETQGWIKSKTGQKEGVGFSKIWITFNPECKSTDAPDASPAPYQQYKKLVRKVESYENSNHKGGAPDAGGAPVETDDEDPEVVDSKSMTDEEIDYTKIPISDLDVMMSFHGDQKAHDELERRKKEAQVNEG